MFRRIITPGESFAVRGWLGTLRALQSTRSVAGELYVQQLEASARRRLDDYWQGMTEPERDGLRFKLRYLARGEA